MFLIMCLDKENGISFNNRRQSRDREVVKDILKEIQTDKLYIEEYSKELFDEKYITVIDNVENEVQNLKNKCFFLERKISERVTQNVEGIIIYYWDKQYPSDVKFDMDLSKYSVKDIIKIKGYSHDEIIKVKYERR